MSRKGATISPRRVALLEIMRELQVGEVRDVTALFDHHQVPARHRHNYLNCDRYHLQKILGRSFHTSARGGRLTIERGA